MKVISSKRIKYRSHTKTILIIISIVAAVGIAVALETASIFIDTAFAVGGGGNFCTTSPSGVPLCTGGGGSRFTGEGGFGGGGSFASGTCDSGTPVCTAHGGAGHGTGVGGSGSGGTEGPQPSFDVNP